MPAGVDTGDTAWMLAATALVMLMTPALALFYAGFVRSKNTLNTFMMSLAALAVVTISWAAIGYSLAFGEGNGFIGGFEHLFLKDVTFEPRDGSTVPHLLFFAFQGTFCIITAALVSGAVVERMRFRAFLAFLVLWSIFVYPVLAHWVFGGGWLATKMPLTNLLAISMLVLALGLAALPHVTAIWQVMLWATAMGLGGGLVMVLFFSVWPRVYGRAHLGRIQGAAQAMTVFASAVGPLLLAWCVELTGSYAAMFYILAAVIGTLAARLHAGAAADATVGVDEELHLHCGPRAASGRGRRSTGCRTTGSFSMRTAATLNSGMPAIGS